MVNARMGSVIMIVLLTMAGAVAAYETQFTQAASSYEAKDAVFLVRSLKYDPYPVAPGDTFDIWIKVENVGRRDAPDVRFSLLSEYPFTVVENLSQRYGAIAGTAMAYQHLLPDETSPQENQVVLKYRVRVAPSALNGTHMLRLRLQPDGENSSSQLYTLPIDVDKTKTAFAVGLQTSTPWRTTFSIANIGEKDAAAVTVRVVNASNVNGTSLSFVGTLGSGEFTTVTFPVIPNDELHSMGIEVSYTDIAGIRNDLQYDVPVAIAAPTPVAQLPETSLWSKHTNWLFGIGGAILGIVIALLVAGRRK